VEKHPEENLTLPQNFLDRVQRYQSRPALFVKAKPSGNYQPISWTSWAEFVRLTCLGLSKQNVRREDRVALLSENRPEWTYVDLGVLSMGAVVVPVYPTSSPQDVAYILENAGAEIIFLSSEDHLERLWGVLENHCTVRSVYVFDAFKRQHPKVHSFQSLLDLGKDEAQKQPALYDNLLAQGKPGDLATLIYTSGTTGPPKGVMLTHHNFIANYLGAKSYIPISGKDSALSFLPLSHVFERLAGYYYMIFHGATIAYAENMQTVPQDIQQIRPTVCAAVPRFYEKVYGKILEQVEAGPALRKKIFYWAIQAGRRKLQAVEQQRSMTPGDSLAYALAKLLVFNKIKKKMGGRIRFFISGGAPLSKDLAEFFFAADILILEGYGLTETSPVIAVNAVQDFRFGTVGHPLPNVEVKIALDGEILTRGACVMKGYFKNPEATAEAMEGGWFHTGDIGTLDNNFLKITDRKKDIIATSGGKKVSPQNIEGKILTDSLFQQVVLVGDKRNYLVALVVPQKSQVEHQAQTLGLPTSSYEQLLKNPQIFQWIDGRFRKSTQGLASYEQVKYFALLSREMTQESGELTPTLKFKRRFIMDKYKDVIEALYQRKPETADRDA
jgi:long-chain acyl-CoA synthetase